MIIEVENTGILFFPFKIYSRHITFTECGKGWLLKQNQEDEVEEERSFQNRQRLENKVYWEARNKKEEWTCVLRSFSTDIEHIESSTYFLPFTNLTLGEFHTYI